MYQLRCVATYEREFWPNRFNSKNLFECSTRKFEYSNIRIFGDPQRFENSKNILICKTLLRTHCNVKKSAVTSVFPPVTPCCSLSTKTWINTFNPSVMYQKSWVLLGKEWKIVKFFHCLLEAAFLASWRTFLKKEEEKEIITNKMNKNQKNRQRAHINKQTMESSNRQYHRRFVKLFKNNFWGAKLSKEDQKLYSVNFLAWHEATVMASHAYLVSITIGRHHYPVGKNNHQQTATGCKSAKHWSWR